MHKIKIWLYRWLIGWAHIFDGFVIVVTLGFVRPYKAPLWLAKQYAKEVMLEAKRVNN